MTGETNFGRSSRLRKILYWIATGLLAAGMLSGGLAQLSGAKECRRYSSPGLSGLPDVYFRFLENSRCHRYSDSGI